MDSGPVVKRRRRSKPPARTPAFSPHLAAPKLGKKLPALSRAEAHLPNDPRVPWRPVVKHASKARDREARKAYRTYRALVVADQSKPGTGPVAFVPPISGSKRDQQQIRNLLHGINRATMRTQASQFRSEHHAPFVPGKERLAASVYRREHPFIDHPAKPGPKVDRSNHGLIGGLGIPLLSDGIAKLPGIKQADLGANFILAQTERPVHALASAAMAAGGHPADSSHTNPLDAALRGFLGKGKEGQTLMGDVLRSHGASGTTAFVGGLAGDIGFNPSTYFTGGAKAVAEVLTETASNVRNLESAARAAGDTVKAAKLAQRAANLERKAKEAPTNRGLQWGFQARAPGSQKVAGFKTSGATSAKVLHVLGADRMGGSALAPAREAARRTIRHIAPDVQPLAGQFPEWQSYRTLKAVSSATARAGRKTAERRGQFYASQLGHGEGEMVANAVEQAPKDVAQASEIRRTIHEAGHKHTPEYQARLAALPKVKDLEQAAQKARRARVKAERAAAKAKVQMGVAHGRAEVLSRNVTGNEGPRLLDLPTPGGKVPPVPVGHIRLYRGEGVRRWTGREWADAPKGEATHGRWFTPDLARAQKYANPLGMGDGYVKYVDVPAESAAGWLHSMSKKPTYILPTHVASKATELEAGTAARAQAEHLARREAAARAPEIRAKRRAAKARLMGMPAPEVYAGGARGVTTAASDLRKAEHAVADARANQVAAEAAVAAARNLHTETRKQLTREAKDLVARHAANSVAALPAHTISELPAHLQPVARQIRKEMADVATREHSDGLLTALRRNYLPHQLADQIEARTVSQVAKGGRHQFAKQRKLEGSIKEINHTIAERQIAAGVPPEPLLSTSIPNLIADRLGRSATKAAHSEMLQAFIDHNVAKPVTGAHTLDSMRQIDSVYKITHSGLHAIEDRHGLPDTAAALKALKEGEHVVTMPKVIGDLERADRHGVMKKLADSSGGNIFDRVNSGIKTVLTVLNIPAYDLRNLAGDLHNAFIGGLDSRSLGDAVRLMKTDIGRQGAEMHMLDPSKFTSRQTITINGVKHDALDFIREAERYGGIHTGYVGAEKHDVVNSVLARRAHGEAKFTDRPGVHGVTHPVVTLRRFGEHRETVPRLGLYISARRRGMGPAKAAEWVNKHLFDYGDLTDTERGLLRRIFPFYTFAARNTRLQAGAIVRRPGPYASYESTRQEAAKSAGLPAGWESQMPDYQQRGIGLPIGRLQNGHAKVVFPNLPMNDLNRVAAGISALGGHPGNELQQTFGNVNLMLKAPLELMMNKNTFFNSAIQADKNSVADPTSHYYVRAPSYVSILPAPAKKLLGVHKTADGYRWPGKVDYLMRLLPQQNFATQVTTAKAGSHGQTGHDALLSQLTGLKFGEWNHQKNEIGRLFNRYDELTLQDRKLKDLGVPTTDPKRAKLRKQASDAYGAALKAEQAAGYKLTPRSTRRRKRGITNAGSGVTSGVSNAGAGVTMGGG